MLQLRTWEELATALASPLDATARRILTAHRDRLAEFADYELNEIAAFVIVEPGEDPAAIVGTPLPEYRTHHEGWIEEAFIVSDDGFGWVVLTRT